MQGAMSAEQHPLTQATPQTCFSHDKISYQRHTSKLMPLLPTTYVIIGAKKTSGK
jgi:hypothetical protein